MYGLPDNAIVANALKAYRAGAPSVGSASGPGFSFTFSGVTLYRPILDTYLNNPTGEVGKYIKKRGKLIVAMAKKQVGVDTGRLRASITMIHTRDSWSQYLKIGSVLPYALMHHEGTTPHVITPKEAGILRFSSGGRVIYTHKVDHPGTRPNRYLSNQLWIARI